MNAPNGTIGHSLIGRGPSGVLVLHGWFGDYSVFEPIYPYLDMATFTYAFVDCRGYGRSRALPGPYTVDQIALDAIAIADELSWKSFALIGHSMGGKAAQRVSALVPARVRCLIGVAPVPASGIAFDPEFNELFLRAPREDDARRAIIDATTGQRLSGRWLDWMVRCSRETSDESAFAAYLPSWSREDFAKHVQSLSTPTLVLLGEHDPAITNTLVQRTLGSWYSNMSTMTIANSGHYPMQETPVRLATLMEEFLKVTLFPAAS